MYINLNDASIHSSALLPGNTKVWYAKQFGQPGFDKEDPEATHILLGTVAGEDPEMLWGALQGEFWSPEGEARNLIIEKGLHHTSMSVGDVLQIGETFHLVAPMGFKTL